MTPIQIAAALRLLEAQLAQMQRTVIELAAEVEALPSKPVAVILPVRVAPFTEDQMTP